MKFIFLISLISTSFLYASSPITVFGDSSAASFNTNWKNLSEWFLKGNPPTYESQINAIDSAIGDWHLRPDSGYFRMAIGQPFARMIFPDSFPWTLDDWNFNAIGMDSLLNGIDPDRRMKIIFHLLGYPRWLMLPEDTIHATPWSGWFIGDTKLPIFAGSNDSGLVLYSQLITAFCNHYDSMGIDFSMTVMAEPNLEAHWSGTWDDANRLYEAFVNGVNASTGGTDIKVGGLVWATGGQYSGVLDSIILWAQYWRNYCVNNDVRYDFICYHHYWRTPDRFDTVAMAFEEAFPGDEFWITEWNYKFSNFLPYDEYQRYVAGMAGATGNLDFLMRAQKHLSHSVLTHFCVVGAYKGYGICHWRDSTNWDYTASGYMFRWLADFGDSELTIENASPVVSVLSAAGDNKIDAMLFNYNNSVDTVDFTIQMSDADSYYCEIWKMNDDSTVTSLFFIAHIDSSDSSIYWTDTTIFLPFPYLVEMDSNATGNLNRIVPVDSNEIYYVKLIKNSPMQVSDVKSIPNSAAIIQAYPNPFNSTITISLSRGVGASDARSGQVGVKIFDIAGHLVADLPVTNCGSPQFVPTPRIWRPEKSLGSGIYLIRTSSDNKTVTKRIIYLK